MNIAYSVCWHIFLYSVLITVSHGNEPRAREACECLPDRAECCDLIHDFGRRQYKILRYRSLGMPAAKRRTRLMPRFFDRDEIYSENKRINDNEADTTGEERRKRSIVDSCCKVETKRIEVVAVVDTDDATNVRDVVRDANNTAPSFVTRYCKEPDSDCDADEGVCKTIQGVHSVLVQFHLSKSNTTEHRFVPVIFNVGCECQSKPDK